MGGHLIGARPDAAAIAGSRPGKRVKVDSFLRMKEKGIIPNPDDPKNPIADNPLV